MFAIRIPINFVGQVKMKLHGSEPFLIHMAICIQKTMKCCLKNLSKRVNIFT